MKTKYGNAKIDNSGYYRITSTKEGNHGKQLHRLIAADYFGEWINDPEEPFDVHHVDHNPLNNCVLNLEPIPHGEHMRLHRNNENSKYWEGKSLSKEHKIKISEGKNSTGYLNVHKHKIKQCVQGFEWRYTYHENGKRKSITSVSIEKLEKKVKEKGLLWKKIKGDD